MQVKAYAKINLALNVKERLANSYHSLESIMLPLDFYDILDVDFSEKIIITCDDANVPTNEDNIVYKAIKLMQDTYNIQQNFRVHIQKRIPIMAGLGGGSSDGASVIKAIKSLCGLAVDDLELAQLSLKIGADLPFCILNRPVLVAGIGEDITPLDIKLAYHVLLVKGDKGVSTKEAYQSLDLNKCDHPNIAEIIQEINTEPALALSKIGNSLEESAVRLNPEINITKAELRQIGFDYVLMSGSGACVFALTNDDNLLEQGYKFFKNKHYFVEKTKIFAE